MNFMNIYSDKNIGTRLVAVLAFMLIATVVFAASPTPTASAQDQDSISGIVVNGSEGGRLPDNFTVLLLTIDESAGQIIEQEEIPVNDDGTFTFSNLVSEPGIAFRVVANGEKYTPSVDMAGVEDWSRVRLTVYDETQSLDMITFSSYVMMIPTIDARSRQAGILAVVNVNNQGDRLWIPDLQDPDLTGFDLLRFNLPEGFSDLSVETELPAGGNILEIPTGFAMTNPVPPGESAILMSYILEYEGDSFDFDLKLPYGADQIRLLVPDGGGRVEASGFGEIESVVVGDDVFNSIEGENFAIDHEVNITFTDLPQPTALQTLSDFFDGRTYIIVIIWVVGLALLAILGYAIYSTRKSDSEPDDDEPATREDVLAEIASLDDDFESGNVDQDKYERRREELKDLAMELDSSADTQDDESKDEPADSDASDSDEQDEKTES